MTTQQTLTGEDTDGGYRPPETLLECDECGEWVLRSRRFEHPHEVEQSGSAFDRSREPLNDDEVTDPEPEPVGAWYDVTISVSVDYRFRIPAWSEHEATDLAEEWRFDATPADSHVVHTETREKSEITTADVPDDFDPYGGTLLHEIFD